MTLALAVIKWVINTVYIHSHYFTRRLDFWMVLLIFWALPNCANEWKFRVVEPPATPMQLLTFSQQKMFVALGITFVMCPVSGLQLLYYCMQYSCSLLGVEIHLLGFRYLCSCEGEEVHLHKFTVTSTTCITYNIFQLLIDNVIDGIRYQGSFICPSCLSLCFVS